MIKLPNSLRWNGREIPIEGAMERALKSEQDTPHREEEAQNSSENLNGYIWVPSIKAHFAKNRNLNGLNWNQAVDKIYSQGIIVEGIRAEMPVAFEFMSGLIYVLNNKNIPGLSNSEREEFLKDILKTGGYKGNWLNARFVEHNKGFKNLGIETLELDSSGNARKKTEPLEQCLWENWFADINSFNKQGLLTKPYGSDYEQGKNVCFYYPRKGYVAWFDADSSGAGLSCNKYPDDSSSSLGVRLIVRPEGASSKI